MLSQEQNARITRVGPDTPGGDVQRRYWIPAALTEELDDAATGGRPVLPVRLLGEDLVLFRDEAGQYGLMDRRCPHRGVDMCYGRLEDGGLRCPFHGWLFDVTGACLEQPAEPPDSTFYAKVRATAYPCTERNGIVFAYMGPGHPPPLPDLDCFVAPDDHSFAFKGFLDCNWLQALEVGIDPAHASFLHRFFQDTDTAEGYGQQFRAPTADATIPVTKVLREYPCPTIEVEPAPHGLRIFALRDLDDGRKHVRITNLLFPNAIVIPMSDEMIITQWHVPIDDETCWWYAIFSSYRDPVDKAAMRAQRLDLYDVPSYRPRLNRANGYGFNAEEQKRATYTGMGMDINVHDQWAVESPGPIQDRTIEHLGTSDRAITANRKLLFRTMDALAAHAAEPVPPDAPLRGPVAIDTITPLDTWRDDWKAHDRARREASAWAADPW